MTRIHLDHVTKTYPARSKGSAAKTALPGLDLVVEDGEFLVLVGPSGCGKSTALRLVAGLEEVTDGTIRFDDVDVTHQTAAQRNIAFVFQNYALYPHMTVAENIGFPLRMAGMPRHEVAERVRAAAAMLRLTEQLDRRPSGISGGQAQRVAMGRAIVRAPDVFLMDEPLSNLDTVLRVEMRAEIAARQQELGKTTVYVTHDGEEAMTMGHRVAVLRDGVLQQIGTPDTVWREPRNAFVAGFVGYPQMNFLEARLSAGPDDTWNLERGGPAIPVPADVAARHPRLGQQVGQPVVIGIRPEHVHPAADCNDSTSLDATVTAVQHLGSHTRVLFTLSATGLPALHVPDLDMVTNKVGRSGELVMTVPDAGKLAAGDGLRVNIDTRSMHLFDGTGERL